MRGMSAIAIQRKAEIIERIAVGHRLTDIAQSLGISQPAISKVLASDPDYLAARETGTLVRIERWEGALEAIERETAPVIVARVREGLSHARWRAEREFPQRWGQRTQIDVTIDLGGALAEIAARRQARAGVSLGVSGDTIEHDTNTINYIESDSSPSIGVTSDRDGGQDAK